MEFPTFRRKYNPTLVQPQLPSEPLANPKAEDAPMPNVAIIGTSFTGRQPIFLDPNAVDEIVAEGSYLVVKMQGGQKIMLPQRNESFMNTLAGLVQCIFPPEKAQTMISIGKVSGRCINPAAIHGLHYAGGTTIINLRSGVNVQIGNCSTDGYREVVRSVYGDEVAGAVKPLPVKVAAVVKPPTLRERQEAEMRHEVAMQKPVVVPTTPRKVNSADNHSLMVGFIDVADNLDTEMLNAGMESVFNDERAKNIFLSLSAKIKELRRIATTSPLEVSATTEINLAILRILATFPVTSKHLVNAKLYMEAQCGRLVGLQPVPEACSIEGNAA